MKFKIDGKIEDSLTWEEFEGMQSGNFMSMRPIISRFVVDDETEVPVPQPEAFKRLGALKMAEVAEIVKQFSETMRLAAVNPTIAAK